MVLQPVARGRQGLQVRGRKHRSNTSEREAPFLLQNFLCTGKAVPKQKVDEYHGVQEEYKKNTIFYDIYKTEKITVDRGIFDVVVLPAIPVAERQSGKKKSKRAASPAKRAAPKRVKKLKRVASLVKSSEAEDQQLEEEVEFNQPQPSPAKEQTQTPPAQIQTQPPQEPKTSSTTQPHTQPQPEASTTQKQTSPHSLHEAESTSSIPIPKIPFPSTDLDAAFTMFTPTQTQAPQTTQAETFQASTPNVEPLQKQPPQPTQPKHPTPKLPSNHRQNPHPHPRKREPFNGT